MASTDELRALLEDLRQSLEPSRHLDAQIAVAIGDVVMRESPHHGISFFEAPVSRGDAAFLSGCKHGRVDALKSLANCSSVQRYTEGETVILGAVQRILPGWAWKLGTCSVSDDAWLVPDFNCPTHGERLRRKFGYPERVPPRSIWDTGIDIDRRPSGRPAIAMCEALITALIEIKGVPS